MLLLLSLWSAFLVFAGLSLASVPWVLWRQQRRIDDLASFASFVAAGPGILLLLVWLGQKQTWWRWDWIWPLYALELLWGAMWIVGGPWLLARCLRYRGGTRPMFLLDTVRAVHACCWLTSTALPWVAMLSWAFGDLTFGE